MFEHQRIHRGGGAHATGASAKVGRDYNDDGDFAQALRWTLVIYGVFGLVVYFLGWMFGAW